MNRPVHPLIVRGREAMSRGDVAAASTAAEERLRVEPRDTDALELRYLAQRQRGEIGKAVETLQAVIAIDGSAAWAFNDLTELLFTHGRRDDAEKVARAALRANPANGQAHFHFGTILSELNDLPSGEWHFRRALELAGEQGPILTNLALNLMQQGRVEEADKYFARSDAVEPRNLQTLAYWSALCEARGDLVRAGTLLDRAAAASSPAEVTLLRAKYLARTKRPAEALALLDAAGPLNGDGQLERGRLLDRLGRYDEAWADFVAAKRKLAAAAGGLEYRADAVEAFFARLKTFFTRDRVTHLPRASVRADVPQPIFVIGFPRSGTTLVEQILCTHPAVRAGGELPFIADLRRIALSLLAENDEPFPENLGQCVTADKRFVATMFRDYYFARAEQYGLLTGGRHAFFTDKMPFNEIWLPVLRMAFPEAKIVHVMRHPLDVCVSMMSNHFTHGFHCGYRIEDIVHHLAAVWDLVEHYRTQLGFADFTLRYESLVASQESETRRLLDYLGLPFDPACLRFHENRRYAPTPSYAQVTERLNDRSLGRYRHYRAALRPHEPQLARVIGAAGYEPLRT
ncbi:MAG TPA: sulfotransferase [Steroidobacteraceae bacterium]|nr:sulfotransferase [Steroidobacteraceae bacterium]